MMYPIEQIPSNSVQHFVARLCTFVCWVALRGDKTATLSASMACHHSAERFASVTAFCDGSCGTCGGADSALDRVLLGLCKHKSPRRPTSASVPAETLVEVHTMASPLMLLASTPCPRSCFCLSSARQIRTRFCHSIGRAQSPRHCGVHGMRQLCLYVNKLY